MWIDSHTHIYDVAFAEEETMIVERALRAGVEKMILPSVDRASLEAIQTLVDKYPTSIKAAVGLHPTEVGVDFRTQIADIRLKAREFDRAQIVAIGEVGIDLYWDRSFLREQQEALALQVEWAIEEDLPLILHVRDAFAETFALLDNYRSCASFRGVFHSFTSNETDLGIILDRFPRFMVGINGIVTFKKSSLKEVVPLIPSDKLLLETDAPYLSPVPYRGKRNEPSYVPYIAGEMATLRQCSIDEIARITTENAYRMFTFEQVL